MNGKLIWTYVSNESIRKYVPLEKDPASQTEGLTCFGLWCRTIQTSEHNAITDSYSSKTLLFYTATNNCCINGSFLYSMLDLGI